MREQINFDLSSVWTMNNEALECLLPPYNPETQQPFGNESEVREYAASIVGQAFFWIPKISDEEKQAAHDKATFEANISRAKQELLATDWCENFSVRNTTLTPHLKNVTEFDNYRLCLRSIVINKLVDVAEWPVKPSTIWTK